MRCVDDIVTSTPVSFELGQNYPNPFNPETVISYTLPVTGEVTIIVYNTLGQKIATLVEGIQETGTHRITFKADKLPSGVYFYRMASGGVSLVKKMVVMR